MNQAPLHLKQSSSPALAQMFADYFQLQQVCTPDQYDEIYKMRYQTYCEEFGYDIYHHKLRERDEYDRFSLQCLLRLQTTQEAAGSIRLIIPPTQKRGLLLPFERNYSQAFYRNLINPDTLPYGSYCEISRMVITKNFRQRSGEQLSPRGVINDLSTEMTEQQRKFPFINIGLYLAAISLFIQSHRSIVFLAIEPKLVRRLDQFGIYLTQASQVIDYHGQRAIYFATRDSLLMDISHFRQDYRGFYFFINDCLRTYP
ncbi:PEP-CTERM/exosortase system-associated acyltransferase [Alkalimarinus alittae]|uniref:PEP-CTERM/exosortase system-associated acyltransferase n=1 Tax=Alkalimarinus alittae TaxID=2961619 RepID=A0ABY6N5P3_9ALTE|nr:PEP-CTERM/exosortase system-associated acyltransferase [Alkalimarinus alittae]UZE97329.1 PEP-CTERM/exosortase system-associated acyltransferase [Alkalimarinus alittae]